MHDNAKCLTFFHSVGHFEWKIPFQNLTTDLGGGLSSILCIQWSEAGQVLETIALTTAACNLHGQQTTSPFMVLIIVSEARSHFGIATSAGAVRSKYLVWKANRCKANLFQFRKKVEYSYVDINVYLCIMIKSHYL